VNTRILVVDDDEKLNGLLKEYLADFGFQVITATHPVVAKKEMQTHPPDLIILDVMLPGMDGFELCRNIRKTSAVPIIMLTARGDVTDRVVGLELGADDYLPKPFEPRELVARIQSVLRRGSGKMPRQILQCGELLVDCGRQSVRVKDQPLELTALEFDLLALFMRHPGQVLSRERIMDKLRGQDWEVYDRSVDVLVSRLRRKLGDPAKKPKFIKAVWGSGYKFIGVQSES
jgi:DNA-binding response OmpR family regulator